MNRNVALLLLLCAISLLAPQSAKAVTIGTVPVGNAGNPADPADGDIGTAGIQNFGAVAYDYRIGTTEVTNAQYAQFLNAKAASDDPLGLYSVSMGSGFGGIARSGSLGSFTYAPITGRGDKPVNFVNWYDSIRFANWLNNGQGSGGTEIGAYTLLGGTATPSNGLSITRNAGATWFLTSENEWYKAAYHQNDGVTSNYFQYPTGGGYSVDANFGGGVGDLTDVGAYASADSPYGTFDQGGNAFEWDEALLTGMRVVRGGSFNNFIQQLRSSARNSFSPSDEFRDVGFRVANFPSVPEPSTAVLAIVACGMMWWWRKWFN